MVNTSERTMETRERLLDAAETLFVERGFTATAMRDIAAAAKCNLAAASYHFGGKESLYHAVFSRMAKELHEWAGRRVQAELDAAGEKITLETALRAFAAAFLDEFDSRDRLAFFDMEMRNQHLPPEAFFKELFQPIRQLGLSVLVRFGPPVDRKTLDLCLESVMGLISHARRVRALAHLASEHVLYHDVSREKLLCHIVAFAMGGIRACAERSALPIEESDGPRPSAYQP